MCVFLVGFLDRAEFQFDMHAFLRPLYVLEVQAFNVGKKVIV